MTNKGCVNAYLNLNVRTDGSVSPCCMSKVKYETDSGSKKVSKDSILNFWNSKSRYEFIEKMNAGEKVTECDACWDEERAGKESKRIRDNKTFENTDLYRDMLPLVVDLSMGNLCNIKCRICSPNSSTPMAAEEEKLHYKLKEKDLYIRLIDDSYKGNFDYDNDYFWKDIIKIIPNVQKYDFAGGEPFFIEKHWSIVQAAVDNGWSKNQHIHYNTNGTIFPEKYMHLLEEFKIVDIQISSDGVGEKFEYMRHPAKWEKVESNIDKFIEAKNKSDVIWYLSACISISAFNVYDFFETFEHYASKGLGIYINVVHDHHGIRILPDNVRNIIIDKLMSKESKYNPKQWHKERDMICNHLKSTKHDKQDWKNFVGEIAVRDNHRKESYSKTFPEFYQILNNLGVFNVER